MVKQHTLGTCPKRKPTTEIGAIHLICVPDSFMKLKGGIGEWLAYYCWCKDWVYVKNWYRNMEVGDNKMLSFKDIDVIELETIRTLNVID